MAHGRLWKPNCPFQIWNGQPGNPYIKTEFRTIRSSQGDKTAIKDSSYDRNGNLLSVTEYDWVAASSIRNNGVLGIPSGATPTRTTTNTYPVLTGPPLGDVCGSTAINNVDDANAFWNTRTSLVLSAPTSTEVSDAGGTKSRVELGYDDGTGTGTANITSESRWRSADDTGAPLAYSNPLTASNSVKISHTYDLGTLTSTTDANLTLTELTLGACPFQVGGATHYLYPTTTTLAKNTAYQRTVQQTWDCNTGLMTSSIDSNSVTKSTSYDAIGRVTQIAEASGKDSERQTNITYVEASSPATLTAAAAALPATITTKRDVLSKADGLLVEVQQLDQRGATASKQTADVTVQKLDRIAVSGDLASYEAISNPYNTTSDPTMGWTRKKFDVAGRLKSVDHLTGSALPYPWNSSSSVTAASNVTSSAATSYDGYVTTASDESQHARTNVFDGLGRLQSVTEDPGGFGYLTTYTYDFGDHLTKVLQGAQTRTFGYDSLGRLMSATNPEAVLVTTTNPVTYTYNQIIYSYDKNGNLLTRKDANGKGVSIAYDGLNRVVTKTYSVTTPATPAVTYCYDGDASDHSAPEAVRSCAGAPVGTLLTDRLTLVGSSVSSTKYLSYDELGQVTSSQQETGQTFPAFSYAYNRLGGLKSIIYPSGRSLSMTFDNAGRVLTVGNTGSSAYATVNSYAPHGPIHQVMLRNGLVETTTFSPRLQPTQIQAGSLLTLGYTYVPGNNGNIAQATITWPAKPAIQQYFGYDNANRLTLAVENPNNPSAPVCPDGNSSWCQKYGYEQYGNRSITMESFIGSVTSSGFDANNHQTATGWNFDVSGNLTTDPVGASYGYDAENRMVSATSTLSGRAIYQYDGDGRRVVRVVCVSGSNPCLSTSSDAVTTTYLYDAHGEVTAEYKSCTTAVNCVDGSPPPATEYLTTDHLGSTRLVTDGSANPVECRDYLPFGEEILLPTNGTPRQGVPCLTQDGRVRQLFTGKEQDTETGLDYFEARYMSAAQGRFISPDPSNAGARPEDPQSWNMFAYARNNPLLYTDQDGRKYRICDTGGNCSDDYSDDDFDKNLSGKARGGAIRQDGEVIGYYQRLSFDDLSAMGNLFFNEMSLRRDASNQFIINFAKESVKTAVTGAILGKVVRVGAEAYLAYRAAQATAAAAEAAAAEVTGLVVQAVQTVSNTGAVASSREIALQAAEEWVGIGSRPIRRLGTGEVIGKISANGQRIYRTTSLGKAEPYINLENKVTGGNLHVRF